MRVAERDGIWSRRGAPVEELPDPFAPPVFEPRVEPPPAAKLKRRRWVVWFYAVSLVLLLLLAWLIVTAPLSRALEPLDDPALLLISADGHPINLAGRLAPPMRVESIPGLPRSSRSRPQRPAR